jgi:hypothetical protein
MWLMRQPSYRNGEYDTTYLDRLLADRKGESFNELTEADEDLAAVSAALDAYLRASASAGTSTGGANTALWKSAGRREALRG